MTPSWLDSLLAARVYDLEQPRFAGMPIHPSHRPGYFYALHRRHRDTYQPERHGPRTRRLGHAHHDGALRHAHRRPVPPGVRPDAVRRRPGRRRRDAGRLHAAGHRDGAAAAVPRRAARRGRLEGRGPAAARVRHHRRRPGRLRRRAGGRGARRRRAAGADRLRRRSGTTRRPTCDAAGVAKSGTLWAAERRRGRGRGRQHGLGRPRRARPGDRARRSSPTSTCCRRRASTSSRTSTSRSWPATAVWEFAFIGIPLKFQGATGSPLRPLALVDGAEAG